MWWSGVNWECELRDIAGLAQRLTTFLGRSGSGLEDSVAPLPSEVEADGACTRGQAQSPACRALEARAADLVDHCRGTDGRYDEPGRARQKANRAGHTGSGYAAGSGLIQLAQKLHLALACWSNLRPTSRTQG